MKKLLLNILLISGIGLFPVSCSRSLDEVNIDESRISDPVAAKLLVPIQYNMASVNYMRANDFTFDIMQVSLDFPNEGNSLSRYYLTENTGAGFWNNSYKWLKQVKDLKEAAIVEKDQNYQAIAMVLNAWIYSNLTDTYGDIPFTEASRLDDGISQPKFDKQKDIYIRLLDDLKAANALFITNKPLTGNDLFYKAESDANGIINWKKFCNSLSLRLLTRILKKNGEVNVHQRIQEIVNDPATYPLFQNNNETAKLNITGVSPLLPPIARPQDFTTGRAASEFFVEALKANNDPRLAMFFGQAKDITSQQNIGYKGAPSGYAYGTIFSYQPSNMNQNLAKAPLNILIYPYAELQFILSELANKGIIQGNAQTFYENGVKAAIEQWGAVVPANYFANPNVAYNGNIDRIMLQKYIALFFVDQQQWFEKRRTGFPVLPNNGGLLNNGNLPQRLMYPPNPKVLNTANYQAAVQQMGGDNINIKTWWNN
ncbi:SusD/RagB family nutrient-binding outer membrane lipoprotein [Chryseobacterium sp. PTM-20240506]|uniref:SusD/RagB family nutrient-binding outer membrane lipoprotein n=1 Tax=unclassified Chryseobacterium TaxID=2593645 RepID=UPI0023595BD6|nr:MULTISPECIES: SusD/RagB family nutrient-binding outer membrane lipoprotein [unclassified Chryseobacterium]MDC8106980.1 SusD/RagB family nutrient-binding outer membrane lipoprotein [Chryseobacterium sp. B21-037]MDQ1802366.1 SusD/RagB family nutrient-binding outer membrane lipoprotein [Chryseobacterium sp. CKR4-1]